MKISHFVVLLGSLTLAGAGIAQPAPIATKTSSLQATTMNHEMHGVKKASERITIRNSSKTNVKVDLKSNSFEKTIELKPGHSQAFPLNKNQLTAFKADIIANGQKTSCNVDTSKLEKGSSSLTVMGSKTHLSCVTKTSNRRM